jgi:DNA-binding CsgD family transcriptional regulator
MTERPFEALGLSADADRAYPLLIATRGVAAAELARSMGVSPERAEAACGELALRGLVRRAGDGRWYPLPPQSEFLPQLSRAQEQLRRGRELLDRLGAEYQRVHEGRRADEIVQVVEGASAVKEQVEDLHAAVREEMLVFARVPGAGPVVDGGPAVRHGVCSRVVVERDALDTGGVFGAAHLRVADRLPVQLSIADRSRALLPLAPGDLSDDPLLLVVRPSGLLDALVTLFEAVWAAGVPLGTPHSPLRLRILGMLVGGSTDAAMARALGVAVRTVQRHISAMERAAGVDNRIQLVWHAARHGWLDGEQPAAGTPPGGPSSPGGEFRT